MTRYDHVLITLVHRRTDDLHSATPAKEIIILPIVEHDLL